MEAWVRELWADFQNFLERVAEYLPNVIGALAILVVGWLLGRVLRYATIRLLNALDALFEHLFPRGTLARLRIRPWVVRLSAALIFWIIMLIALDVATRVLNIPLATRWLENLLEHVPTVIAVLVIAVAGLLASVMLRDVVTASARSAGVSQANQLGLAVQVGLLAIAATVGLDQLGIDVDLLITIIAVVLAAGLGGLALAFSLGATSYVANVMAARHVGRLYRIGETVRLDEHQGVIASVGPTFVTIGTIDGIVAVPAKLFLDRISLSVQQTDDTGGDQMSDTPTEAPKSVPKSAPKPDSKPSDKPASDSRPGPSAGGGKS